MLIIWRELEADELVRSFFIFNAGHQKFPPSNLLDLMQTHLQNLFEEWGIRLLTDDQNKLVLRRRSRKPPKTNSIPSTTHFRYESLVNGLLSYVSGDPHLGARRYSEQERFIYKRIDERVLRIAGEICRKDFSWICLDLNKLINKKYADFPKWRSILQTSDNFLLPLMAALGEARSRGRSFEALEQRKRELVGLIDNSWHDDPLRLFTGSSNSLEKVLDGVRSNIGRSHRAIIYKSWILFFLKGISTTDYPIKWRSVNTTVKTREKGDKDGN